MTAPTTTPAQRSTAKPKFDLQRVRADFPILARRVRDRPLAYLDNAATTHKPAAVIDALADFYRRSNANVHRGAHQLSAEATEAYENARASTARFLGADRPEEIIFLRGVTEAMNLVAHSLGGSILNAGDEVLITEMEHHSNIVPWQMVCQRIGASLRAAPINDRDEIRLDEFEKMLSERTKIVSIGHVSNALGTINPVREIAAMAHNVGATVVVDGAQAAAHLPIDVRDLGCDFYAISGHKMFAPTGIGALFGRLDLLESIPPFQGGGEMIREVRIDKTTYADPPQKFEAGTPNIAGAVGLAAAIDYLDNLDRDAAEAHEHDLLRRATDALSAIPQVRLYGTASHKLGAVSFTIDNAHPHDVATVLDQHGVAIRSGHHCAQPLMERLGVPATARASLAMYNTAEEIDALAAGVRQAAELFA